MKKKKWKEKANIKINIESSKQKKSYKLLLKKIGMYYKSKYFKQIF